MNFVIEPSAVGRIAVPEFVPAGRALFYTTGDFQGDLTGPSAGVLQRVMRERFSVEAELVSCHQVHGIRSERVGATDRWVEKEGCDALWSSEPQVALGIKVADCLPVTLVDSSSSVIANIHSGWRGAAGRIVEETLDQLPAINPNTTYAWLGPSIRLCCFEVGEDVVEQFEQAFGSLGSHLDRRSGRKPHLDLASLTFERLTRRGLRPDAIFDSKLCTRCEGSVFHSYRRNGPRSGRNLAIVAQ